MSVATKETTSVRKCLACKKRHADTLSEFPALCGACMSRSGVGIKKGTTVIVSDEAEGEPLIGIVDRLEDGIAVVKDGDGEVWLPVVLLVAAKR